MWGNSLGWGISVVLVMFACFLGYIIYTAGQPTSPTGWVQKSVHPLEVPGEVAKVVPPGADAADAGSLYRDAINDYQTNKDFYNTLLEAKDLNSAAVSGSSGLQSLLKASNSTTMNLFRANPESVVTYQLEKPDLEAIYSVGRAAARVALLKSVDKDFDSAKKYYSAVFALGVHLFQERVVYDELSKGEDLMGTGAGGLRRVAERINDTMKVLDLKNWDGDRVTDFKANIEPVWGVISSIDSDTIGKYAGDIFEMASDKNTDHMWRTESILKVGRLRFNASKSGDQLLAKRFLRDLAADTAQDPAIHAAAVKARDLTIEDYRNLR